ncbi:MAG: hypothetical protein SF187_06245 [Deltaproteobacteria bacterium]|nr:hypothetical protein [Deltaproteobacteria bacterium]
MQMACAILSTASSLAGCGDGLFEPAAASRPDSAAPADGDQFVMTGGRDGRDAAADAQPSTVTAEIGFKATSVALGPAAVNFVDGTYKDKTNVTLEWLEVADVKVRGPYGRILRVTFDAVPQPKPSVSIDVGALVQTSGSEPNLRAIANALVIARLQDQDPKQWIKLSKQLPAEDDGLSVRIVALDYPLATTSTGKWTVSFAILLNCDAPDAACSQSDLMSCEKRCSAERPGYNCSMSRLCQ